MFLIWFAWSRITNFENHGKDECGFISINVPAGIEQMMPQLVKWFGENPLRSVDDAEQQHAADGAPHRR